MGLRKLVVLASLTCLWGLLVPSSKKRQHKMSDQVVCHRVAESPQAHGTCKDGQHVFSNGLHVCEETIVDAQKKRYKIENLHEPEESKVFYSIIRRAGHGDTFVDVGAAIGYYALWAMQIAPSLKVWAWNPSPDFQTQFANHARLNFPGKNGEKTLSNLCLDFRAMTTNDGDDMVIGSEYGSGPEKKGKGHTCKTVTYATWAAESGVHSPFMVMTDIQGGEKTVIPSMLINGTGPNLLSVGTHSSSIHDAVRATLCQQGYSVLFEEGFGSATLAPDGIIFAVRNKWTRAGEFQSLAKHFADRETMRLPFDTYKDAEKSW